MNNSDYWKQRFIQLEAAQNKIGAETYAEIEMLYRRAIKDIESKIALWYQRLSVNNGVSMAEARKLLSSDELKEFKWDVSDYIKYGKENAVTGQWVKELENASARYHISKFEALKIQMRQSLEELFAKQHKTVSSTMSDVYKSGYYHTAYELQKGFHVGWDIASINQSKVDRVLSKPWAVDGKNFLERIWDNKEKLINEVYNELSRNIITGADPQKAIDAIAKKMNTSKLNAGRLVMTEEAYFSSAAQKDCFKDLDVEEYEIVATLDSHTSDVCRSLDGKIFHTEDYQAGVTAPPFHVRCRSVTAPHFDDDFGSIGERAARDEDGKTYYVPEDMTYDQWKKRFIKDSVSDLDKNQFKRFKAVLQSNSPKTLEDFVNIKYNKKDEWENLKSLVISRNYLQEQLAYVFNGEKLFIPNHAVFDSKPKPIAGEGSTEKIRVVDKLIAKYGGNDSGWSKKVASIKSDKYIFDVHWYEYDGIQYEMKLKYRKERKK